MGGIASRMSLTSASASTTGIRLMLDLGLRALQRALELPLRVVWSTSLARGCRSAPPSCRCHGEQKALEGLIFLLSRDVAEVRTGSSSSAPARSRPSSPAKTEPADNRSPRRGGVADGQASRPEGVRFSTVLACQPRCRSCRWRSPWSRQGPGPATSVQARHRDLAAKPARPSSGASSRRRSAPRTGRFNCTLKGYVNRGDPCKNTKAYYEGPVFPAGKAGEVNPLRGRSPGLEHGDLQEVQVTLVKRLGEEEVRKAFKLPASKTKTLPRT